MPKEEIQLDIIIKNPQEVGSFSYIFYLIDVNGRRFGDAFEFEFIVKNSFHNPWNLPKNLRYQNKLNE